MSNEYTQSNNHLQDAQPMISTNDSIEQTNINTETETKQIDVNQPELETQQSNNENNVIEDVKSNDTNIDQSDNHAISNEIPTNETLETTQTSIQEEENYNIENEPANKPTEDEIIQNENDNEIEQKTTDNVEELNQNKEDISNNNEIINEITSENIINNDEPIVDKTITKKRESIAVLNDIYDEILSDEDDDKDELITDKDQTNKEPKSDINTVANELINNETKTENEAEHDNEEEILTHKEQNKSMHAFSMDMASLIQVLDTDDNNYNNENELSEDTDEEDGNDESESSNESSFESDIDKIFDLADSDALQQMMTVRDELKNANERTKKLWKTKTKTFQSRKNIFSAIQKKPSRDPFHNALVDAATVSVINEEEEMIFTQQNENNDEDDEYMKKMNTQFLELTAPKKTQTETKTDSKKHTLALNTQDFNDPIVTDEVTGDVPTFAALNDGKSETIRMYQTIDKVKQKSAKEVGINDDDIEEEIDDEFTLQRRIWYIIRCIVIIYLYISTSFEFAYLFNENKRNLEYLILNWLCDLFMWINIILEYLYFRDDVGVSSTKKIIDDINEAESKLDAMKNMNAKSYRKGTKDLQKTIQAMKNLDANEIKAEKSNQNDDDIMLKLEEDHHCLNKIIFKLFGKNKYASIVQYRLSHFFYFDFFINFPFDIVCLIIFQSWKWFIICRLLKLFHILRLFEYWTVSFIDWIPDRGIMRSAFVSRLAKIIIIGIFWLHLWSCIWFFLGSNLFIENNGDYISNNNEYDTWLTAYYSKLKTINGDLKTTHYEYLWSIYFVTVTFSTVGYGDVVPMNYLEIILIIVFQMVNFVFITIFVAELAPVIEEFFFLHLSRGSQHRLLRNCFESINISIDNQDKLCEANRYFWRNQYGLEEFEILNELPRSLSMEVKYQFLERSLLSFIKHIIDESVAQTLKLNKNTEKEKLNKLASLRPQDLIPHGLVRKIANKCEPRSYIRDQVILSQNVENNLLYLLIDGKVEKKDEDNSLDEPQLKKNYPNFFGHESFWRSKTKSQFTYTAKSDMVCVFVISSKQIRSVLKPYSEIASLFATIFKKAYPTISKHNELDTIRRKPAILQAATDNEIKQQDIRYTIYRYTSLIWDILNGFCTMTQCYIFVWALCFFILPARNFNKTPYLGPLMLNWIIDILFAIDIVLSTNNITQMVYFYPTRSKTQKQLQTRNIIYDIIIVIPFELILIPFAWKTTYIYLLRILKWLRILYISYSWRSWVELLRTVHIPSKFSRLLFAIFAVLHVFACLWFLIGTVSYERNQNLNWIINDPTIQENDNTVSLSKSWLRSYYFVLITETTIGYGGILPFSLPEIVYDVILLFIGSILYWFSISFFATSASYRRVSRIEHTNLVTATEYLLRKQLSFRKNEVLMVRLQHYFDFVLQNREGAVSFWGGQKPSLQTLLRYQLLTTATNTKKLNDPQKYTFLEWLPDEIMFEWAKHLQWIVICKGQHIKIKQSGNDSFVLFLITGTLWSPYSNYIFSRHAKSEDNSEIVTFNLACLSPLNIKITQNSGDIDSMQMLSTYYQIDVDPDLHKSLHKSIYGVYEISDSHGVGLQNHDHHFKAIYQLIPPEQPYDKNTMQDYDSFMVDNKQLNDGIFTFLVYESNHNTNNNGLGVINEDEQKYNKKDMKQQNNSKWRFLTMERNDGILNINSRKEIAYYELTDEKSIDPKYTNNNDWTLSKDKNKSINITITDELHFEALETCDIVQLYQKDVMYSFEENYPIRFDKYVKKATKTNNQSILVKRGSILSPKSLNNQKQNKDSLDKLIMNDSKFAFNKNKNKNKKEVRRASSNRLLPQFKDTLLNNNLATQRSMNGDDIHFLRQETTLFINNENNQLNTEHLHFKEVMKRYYTEIKDMDNMVANKTSVWLQKAESIAIYSDKYRILKIIWYLSGLSFIALLQFVLPMRAVFQNDVPFNYFALDIIVQIFFIIDLFVQWNLSKKDAKEKQRLSSQGRILKILDYFLVIPWPFIGLIFSWKIYYYFRLFDLLRITRVKHYWNDMRRELVHYTGKFQFIGIMSVHTGLSAIIFHIFALFLTASYCACLWYIIAINNSNSWINQDSKPVTTITKNNEYTLSVYWAMVSMSSVGYGDLKPINFRETLFALFALPFMVSFYVRFMGDMASFAGNVERSTKTAFYKKFSHTLLRINRRIEHLELFSINESKSLLDLKKKIRIYLLSLWKERAGISEEEIYKKLPYFLSRDISFQCRKKFLSSIECLSKIPQNNFQLLKIIAFKLQHHIITRNEEIPLNQIFIVERGDIMCIDNQTQKTIIFDDENNDNDENDDELIDNDIQTEHEKNTNSFVSKLFDKMNPTKLTSLTNTEQIQNNFKTYFPPKPTNKKQHKLKCVSHFASLYSLPYESLLEIKNGYEKSKSEQNVEIMQDILDKYWAYDNNTNESYSDEENDQKKDEFEYAVKSSRTIRLADGDEADDLTKSKYLLDGEIDNPNSYHLLYNPKRIILRRSHPIRLCWDLLCVFCLFLYAIMLPLQFSNVFHTNNSMINALIFSFCIDIIFIIDFLFRFWIFAPHNIKMFNPYYVMIGKYDNDKLKQEYKETLSKHDNIGKYEHLLFRDLPKKKSDVRPLYQLILESIAMVPLNVIGLIIPSLYNSTNMNFYFRLNKIIYLFILFDYANQSINAFKYKYNIYFLTVRIFRISILMTCVIHLMSCIWLQLAEFEQNDTETWLTEMDTKKLNIEIWSDNPLYAYLLSLYFVVITMTTTGYGDITPVSLAEINMTNILIILGDTLMALMAGVFIQYISNINQPSLEIVKKERSITHYLQHRSKEIMKRSEEIMKKKENEMIFNENVIEKQKQSFKKLNKKIKRYFKMQLDYQDKVSTISSLTRYLPLYYRMKLLHTLYESKFKRYPFLYNNKNLYFRLLDNIKEEIYTYWDDNSFEFIIDPQQSKIIDFMMVQFGQCVVYSREEWTKKETNNKKYKLKKEGDLIGFRSLILQNSNNRNEKIKKKMLKREKPKCIITPMKNDKNEKFKIVSILKITQHDWTQIINDVFVTYEQKMEFEKMVKIEIKHDIQN